MKCFLKPFLMTWHWNFLICNEDSKKATWLIFGVNSQFYKHWLVMYVGGRLTPVHGLHIYLHSWTCPPTLPALPTPPWRTTCKYLCWPPPPLLSWLNGEETCNNVWASHSHMFESGMLIFVCLWAANVFVCSVISSDLLEVVFFHSEDQKWCIFFAGLHPDLPPSAFISPFEDVRSWRGCGEEEAAMRKSVSPLPGNEGGSSAGTTRVFGVPLEEVTRTHTISGHEVPALVKHIVEYIEEHGEWHKHLESQ